VWQHGHNALSPGSCYRCLPCELLLLLLLCQQCCPQPFLRVIILIS
jgi:hypothetical protein